MLESVFNLVCINHFPNKKGEKGGEGEKVDGEEKEDEGRPIMIN